jgi:hypothetical protein
MLPYFEKNKTDGQNALSIMANYIHHTVRKGGRRRSPGRKRPADCVRRREDTREETYTDRKPALLSFPSNITHVALSSDFIELPATQALDQEMITVGSSPSSEDGELSTLTDSSHDLPLCNITSGFSGGYEDLLRKTKFLSINHKSKRSREHERIQEISKTALGLTMLRNEDGDEEAEEFPLIEWSNDHQSPRDESARVDLECYCRILSPSFRKEGKLTDRRLLRSKSFGSQLGLLENLNSPLG